MVAPVEKFCPACKNKNPADAEVCSYCGAPMDAVSGLQKTTEKMHGRTIALPPIDKRLEKLEELTRPSKGVAVYVMGRDDPIVTVETDEFVLGRMVEEAEETLVDLNPHDAGSLGVSRRHAAVRKANIGYEIVDLGSTNGTWMNDQRLVPFRPYLLVSGIPIRLGNLYVYFVCPDT